MIAVELVDYAPTVLTVLASGGLVGAVIALLKLRPEAGQITVVAAQGAVVVQQGVIETLNEENQRLRERIETLERTFVKFDELVRENGTLRRRVTELEREVEHLRTQVNGGADHS